MSELVRAVVFAGPGRPLAVESLTLAPPGADEVRVRYTASGVCRSDLHVVDGDWPRPAPLVLGHEGAGTVEELGTGVSGLAAGDSVVLTWVAPCGRCRECRHGRSWLCTGTRSGDHVLADGSTRLSRRGEPVRQYLGIGTFAEAAVVTRAAVVPVPAAVPPAVAALLGCCVATGYGAVVNTAAVRPGEVVVVVGCGGVGLSAIMAAALSGAGAVVAVDTVPAKLELAGRVGATDTVLAAPGWGAELARTGPPVDVALDCIGSPAVVGQLCAATAPGGRIVLAGMTAAGTPVAVDGYSFPDRGLSLLGCCYGSTVAAVDLPRIAAAYLAGRLPLDELVSARVTLDDVPDAFRAMRAGDGARTVIDHRGSARDG